jgi:dTDP-glucose 4,6-dehydratase
MYKLLITGGAGFIGSHVVAHFAKKYPHYAIFNLDKLTYAANLDYLEGLKCHHLCEDVNDLKRMHELFQHFRFDAVIHLAAESHVDRSIESPIEFVHTNVLGTVHLLQAALGICKKFYHISTDEVYGSLGAEGFFSETSSYQPSSPYSASKAASDHFVRAYGHTYGLPYLISHCSNNFGPHQYHEKLIPQSIKKFFREEPVPLYGTGTNVRDWLYVMDHVEAIDLIFHHGHLNETYVIGGECEKRNIDLLRELSWIMDDELGRPLGTSQKLITFVKDRPGHDQRYAIDCTKVKKLGWTKKTSFNEALLKTVRWCLASDALVEV